MFITTLGTSPSPGRHFRRHILRIIFMQIYCAVKGRYYFTTWPSVIYPKKCPYRVNLYILIFTGKKRLFLETVGPCCMVAEAFWDFWFFLRKGVSWRYELRYSINRFVPGYNFQTTAGKIFIYNKLYLNSVKVFIFNVLFLKFYSVATKWQLCLF